MQYAASLSISSSRLTLDLMGNSFTCPCSESTKEGVMVMKADGGLLRFKRGVQAREVAAANPGFRVVRCDSDRTVLWGSAELESNRLYFLVPEDKARCRATFERYKEVCESKGLAPPRSTTKGKDGDGGASGSLVGASAEFQRLSWTPQLRTIPEILSPPGPAEGAKDDRGSTVAVKSPQAHCSLGKQLDVAAPASSPTMVR